jgi:DNA polymerase V
MNNKSYIAIDLKSFYASVECIERGLDPMDTNLVVADNSRTEKTICLAVTPSLKSYGIYLEDQDYLRLCSGCKKLMQQDYID